MMILFMNKVEIFLRVQENDTNEKCTFEQNQHIP